MCDKEFTRPWCLKEHMKRMHSETTRNRYSCDHCGKDFAEEPLVLTHEMIDAFRVMMGISKKKSIGQNTVITLI